MPLLELDSREAWKNIFQGPSRPPALAARLDRLAQPAFSPSFKLARKAKIFTIGSCFARNIERHLGEYEFDLPTRQYFGRAEVINKYSPYSILQEVRWALKLDEAPAPDHRLVHIRDDDWVDLHLHTPPTPKSQCLYWITQSQKLFSEIPNCPFFVITLGLVEVWYDRKTSSYINEPLNFVRHYPDNLELQNEFAERFVFRILSYDETFQATSEIFSLLRSVSPGCKAILTVSPVPLAGTFSGKDAMTANMYSKSVLRAVAGEICARFDFVDYFPSYESVMLSPIAEAWEDDGVHVKDAIVALNVSRMVSGYVEPAA